jgi:hypothetical protein
MLVVNIKTNQWLGVNSLILSNSSNGSSEWFHLVILMNHSIYTCCDSTYPSSKLELILL